MSEYYRQVAKNKKAYHDYHIMETFEAGLELKGTEVKSLRVGGVDLKGSFAIIKNGELFLIGLHIAPYARANKFNHKPLRRRKLLMSKQEIRRLRSTINERGFTLVPLSVFFRGNWAKVQLGLVKGKAQYDKRESIKRRETNREISRQLRGRHSR